MKKMTLPFLFLFFQAQAQLHLPASGSPSSADSIAYADAVQQFHHLLSPENALYNGGEYVDYETSLANGHPYFLTDFSQDGWVVYNGMRYDHLQLWYDIVSDVLVIHPPAMAFKMELLSPRVQSFSLSGQQFIRIVRDSVNNIRTGFYQVLYEGQISLIKRSRKNIQEYTTQQGVERKVYADSTYYMIRDGQYLDVSGKRSLLRAMQDKRSTIQSFIRKNRLPFKRGRDATLKQIVTYYDGLTHEAPTR